MKPLFPFSILATLSLASPALAHEAGAPFSGAITDLLALHHAHLENEQRLNGYVARGIEGPLGEKRTGYESELELAWASEDFKLGAEFFIPLLRIPSAVPGQEESGIGDVEIRPIKYAFVNRPDFIVSTATGIVLPTGDKNQGLGEGNTTLSQLLFLDKAYGNWFAGFNLGADRRVKGDDGRGVEYGMALSYSFIRGTAAGEVASPVPAQQLVLAPSVELIGEQRYGGPDDGEHAVSLLPGLTLWWPHSGWQFRVGVMLPQSGEKEADRTYLVQIGNHFNWGTLLGRRD